MSQLPPFHSLMSPPEAQPLDSYTTPTKSPHTPSHYRENTLAPMVSKASPEAPISSLISPPASPWTSNIHKVVEPNDIKGSEILPDPVLYPTTEDGDSPRITEPLFPSTPERIVAEDTVDKYMAVHMMQFDNKLNRPTREEYLLACSVAMTVGKAYNRNPGAYMKRTREETDEHYYKSKRICAAPSTTTPPVRIAPKPSSAVRQPRKPPVQRKVSTPKPKPHTRVSRKPKASPMESALGTPGSERLGTPEAGARAAQKEKDYRFWLLPDYCPPLETLVNPKPLRNIDWNGKSSNPLDLSNDEHRQYLHEAELRAAEICRLTCAQYLTTKRRIFMARLQCYKNKKEFRRTDAQQACNIDVNKASGLWVAYQSVGWLDPKHMERFLSE